MFRSNSFTSDAGTQTPRYITCGDKIFEVGNWICFRIKAKAKLYFEEGGSASASEESLTDTDAKENIL